MVQYEEGKLRGFLAGMPTDHGIGGFESKTLPYLIDCWLGEYARRAAIDAVVETRVAGFFYLFDIAAQRLIAAWGLSRGANHSARDKGRMSGHPLGARPHYHRGHAIPHSLGGPTDINLVPQLGSLNVGAFRRLERAAVNTPGALYFSYWIYRGPDTQTPCFVQQGLLVPNGPLYIKTHAN